MLPKKDGRNRLVVNLKPLNQFLVYEHFKMEGIHMLKDLLRKGDYLIKIDLKDAYLTVPVWKGHQKHLRFELVEGHSARVCLLSVWASHYSQGFRQTYEACSSHAETKGSASNYLFRRHADHGRVSQPGNSPCSHSSESTRKCGVCYQLQKVSADFKSANRVFRLSDRFSSFVAPTPRRKVAKNRKTMPKITKFRRGLNTRIIKIPGPPNFFISGSFPSPSSLSTASQVKESQLEHPSVLRCNNSSGLPSEGGTGLVARGVVLRRSKYRGPMVYRRTEVSDKLSRTPCRVLCHQNLLQKQSSRTCQTVVGQSISNGLHQQNGGHTLKNSSQVGDRSLELVPRPQNTYVSGTPTRSSEFESRQGISCGDRPQRLEVEPSIFQNPGSEVGLLTNFPVTIFSIATDAFLMNWRDFRGYAFPPFALVGRCFTAGNGAERRPFSISSSCVASTALVPSSSTLTSGQASVISSRPRAFNERQP